MAGNATKSYLMRAGLVAILGATAGGQASAVWYDGTSSFTPYYGYFTEGVVCSGTEMYWTKARFKFSSSEASSIAKYKAGTASSDCGTSKAYLTADISAVGDSWDDELDAYSTSYIYTNLPSPVKDVEDDGFLSYDYPDGENEEAEVTATGTIASGTYYYVTVYWWDYRDGDSGDGGNIEVNFDMSKKDGEYNVCQAGDGPQEENAYGDDLCDT